MDFVPAEVFQRTYERGRVMDWIAEEKNKRPVWGLSYKERSGQDGVMLILRADAVSSRLF